MNLLPKLTLIAGLIMLAGCGKTPQDNSSSAPSSGATVQSSATAESSTVHDVAYYSAHLEEAKETWHKCLEMNPQTISDSVRKDCSFAQSAWEMQPYKPKPSTFSSSGGRH
jgi:hypothetical protein